MNKFLQAAEKYTLYLTVFLIPLFILPFFPNPYDTPKLALLAVGVSLVLLLRLLKTLSTGRLDFYSGNFDLPILILAAAYLASAIFVTPNKMEAFFLPGTALLIVLGSILYFLSNMVFGTNKKGLIIALLLSGLALATFSLFATVGVLTKIPQLFTPSGGQLANVVFFSILLPTAIGMVVSERELVKRLFWATSLLIIILGLGVSLYPLLPGKPSSLVLPPYQTSWAVAIESLKESPVLGVGPANFLSAFGRFRPLDYNSTPLWANLFPFASNFTLTLLAEVGLLGLAGYALVLVTGAKTIQANLLSRPWIYLSLALGLLATLLVPANSVFLVTLFVILSISSQVKRSEVVISPSFILFPPILLVVLFWFFASRALVAEAKFQESLNAFDSGNAKITYEKMVQAINLNPYVDRYHAAFAQVNLVIARNLSQKKDLKDEDKKNISGAIQTAISEGKATVALNPQRAAGWALLGSIYQAVMPLAQGADNFAIQTYSQAISLDPIDPNLRITLGGVYYALGRFDDAIGAFQMATLAKGDLANAHFNLSAAYREKGDIDKAISEIKIVLTLVAKGSNDEKTAHAELDNLEKKRPPSAKATEGQGNLIPPKKVSPAIKPQLTLPQEATPPASP